MQDNFTTDHSDGSAARARTLKRDDESVSRRKHERRPFRSAVVQALCDQFRRPEGSRKRCSFLLLALPSPGWRRQELPRSRATLLQIAHCHRRSKSRRPHDGRALAAWHPGERPQLRNEQVISPRTLHISRVSAEPLAIRTERRSVGADRTTVGTRCRICRTRHPAPGGAPSPRGARKAP